jgi:hypothetical protein
LFLRVAIALGLVGGDVLVTWVLLDSVALMAFTLVLAGLAVLLLWLIDTIKPTPGGQKGRFPPYGG